MYEHSPAVFGYETGGAVSVRPPESTPQAASEAKLPSIPQATSAAKSPSGVPSSSRKNHKGQPKSSNTLRMSLMVLPPLHTFYIHFTHFFHFQPII